MHGCRVALLERKAIASACVCHALVVHRFRLYNILVKIMRVTASIHLVHLARPPGTLRPDEIIFGV